jgi:hypothetical protein
MARLGRAQPFPPKLAQLLPASGPVNANAEVATATATAYNATCQVGTFVTPTAASVTATANNATTSVKPTAGRGTATATANNASVPSAVPFVASASANGHYLKDQNGDPYFIQGNSPQNAVTSATDLADIDDFFADQQARGFNSAQIHLVGETFAADWDGNSPFSGFPLGTPVTAYWVNVDAVFDAAETYGFTLWATVIDNITCGGDIQASATTGECFTYGQFLGARYKDRPNLVWTIGNDFQADQWAARNAKYQNILAGIRDQGDTHLATIWGRDAPSDANTSWDSLYDADLCYIYDQPPYVQVGDGYQLTRTGFPKPTFWGEGTYYGEKDAGTTPPLSTNLELRKLAWWTITWGGCGHFFGTHEVWQFADWASELTADIYDHLALIPAAFGGLDGWELLVPDFSHVFQTGGRGTTGGSLDSDTFSTAAFINGGALAVVYFPSSRGSITFDTTKLSGSVTAYWLDPTSGDTTTVPNPAAPTHPGNNDGGDPDWVLVFESSPDTSVSAGSASATATANNATKTVAPNSGTGSATAAAQTPAPSVKTTGGVATATATAYNATVSTSTQTNASAGSASATATALDATCSVKTTGGLASVTVTANNASVTTDAQTSAAAGAGSATATARDATVKVAVSAEVATATATANQPAVDNGAGIATYFRIVRLSRPGVVRLRRPRLDL